MSSSSPPKIGGSLGAMTEKAKKYNPKDQLGSGPDGGAALGGAQKQLSGEAIQTGYSDMIGDTGHGPRSITYTEDPMQGMIDSQPDYAQSMYGEGGYDPDAFAYTREAYDPSQLQGYDIAKLGGEGFELGGYDVAHRGGLQGYDPTQVDAMNFDPYRRNQLQDVDATSASGQASAEGAMARTGGMSASDRMAMASQFNRDKIAGRSQSLGQTDELEAQNRFQTQMENARAQTGADKYLAGQENLGAFTDQRLGTDANRYGADTQNEAARINAASQTTANQRLGEARDSLSMQNVQDRNELSRANVDRRYGEKTDLYGGQVQDWEKRGQLMAGNPASGDFNPLDWSKNKTYSAL